MSEVISADELELLSFFEVEPKRCDRDVPWPYNDYLYEITRGDFHLSCAVAPAYKDVRIILKRGGTIVYELNATDVMDVRYHNDKGREVLEIHLNERDKLWLRVKPDITIAQEAKRET